MSHATQPTVSLPAQIRTHRVVALSALLGLLAAIAVVLVLAIDAASPGTKASFAGRQPAPASIDVEHRVPMAVGAAKESAVAAAVGIHQSAGPDESSVAASIGTSTARPAGGIDESAVGNSVSMRPVRPPARPDESGVAAAIAGH